MNKLIKLISEASEWVSWRVKRLCHENWGKGDWIISSGKLIELNIHFHIQKALAIHDELGQLSELKLQTYTCNCQQCVVYSLMSSDKQHICAFVYSKVGYEALCIRIAW